MSTKKNYCENATKKMSQGSGGRLGCVQRTEVIVKMQKKRSRVGEGQGGCERRIEVFVKIKKKMGWGEEARSGWGGGGGGGSEEQRI